MYLEINGCKCRFLFLNPSLSLKWLLANIYLPTILLWQGLDTGMRTFPHIYLGSCLPLGPTASVASLLLRACTSLYSKPVVHDWKWALGVCLMGSRHRPSVWLRPSTTLGRSNCQIYLFVYFYYNASCNNTFPKKLNLLHRTFIVLTF